jgi:hypothetical protein
VSRKATVFLLFAVLAFVVSLACSSPGGANENNVVILSEAKDLITGKGQPMQILRFAQDDNHSFHKL